MKNLYRLLPLILLLAVGVNGCGKKEEQKPQPPAEPAVGSARKPTQVVVPEKVKGKWKAVVISVKNKVTEKDTSYTVPIGSELAVPESQLLLKVQSFLPDFTMEGTTLTSKSNEAKNPAAQVIVLEKGKEIFKGWLFTLYPTTHAFQHPTYGFTLVDFIKE